MAVMAFAGMSVAQDVWSSGFFTASSGIQSPAVYKNSTLMYSVTNYVSSYYGECSDLDVYNGNVYWAENTYSASDNSFNRFKINKNSSVLFTGEMNDGSHIYDLQRSHSVLIAAGCKNKSGVKTAWYWRDDASSPSNGYQIGNGTQESEAYGITLLPEGNAHYFVFCGYQRTASDAFHGVIWKGTSAFHEFSNGTKLYGITYFNGDYYSVGSSLEGSSYKLKVWRTDASTGSTTTLYTLSSSMSSNFISNRFSSYIDDAGDIYVNGMDDSAEKVWKNGNVLYSTGYYLNSVVANTNGVYFAGCSSNNANGKIWKDGSVLYSPANSNRITNLFIEEPECTNSQVRSLPFTENFENGSTSWPCWTKIDEDGNNGTDLSYWSRAGNRLVTAMTGQYCARHAAHTDASQNGWLITPRLFLQPGRDETKLTFKSLVTNNFTIEVYVYTGSDPTNISAYERVLNETQNTTDPRTITIDLKGYQGHAVYIGFRYFGAANFVWDIDDVSVTETFSPCSASNAPYECDFDGGFASYSCWTAYDADMSGGQACWRYYSTDGKLNMWHPSNSAAQTGWLYSPRISLPTGNFNYTLSYQTRNAGSNGTGESHTVWIAVDKTGAYVPADYTLLYTEPDYPGNWTERTIDLTPYKGHTVSIAFKYMGTNAHHWNIDDFAITKEVAQYTVTAASNNTAWGTVSGGGNFDPGATCVLHATPASGYVFQEWRKGNTPVSINPNYSFTVNESATYTAYFGAAAVTYYTITTNVTPTGAGTVTGGGLLEAGSTATLTANANAGYTFDHWQDGNTDNPRTITVTGDATYTATFTQDTYTITTNVTPAGAGTVTGGGNSYHYGQEVTLTATPNANYEFAGWQDGETDNPRTITVTGNATYTATFNEAGTTMYNVTANVSPAGAGTVSGTGTFEAGATTSLHAIANTGYTFDHWQDGTTTNPRSVTVTTNMNFTAYFTQNTYIINALASPAAGGTVSGGGSYHYGDEVILTATAATGYEFQGWSDGSNENPHTITVTGNATYTATFSPVGATYYNVSAYVSPAGAGTVTGTGSFAAGSTTTLTATANSGYVFDHWNDGLTSATRTVTVNSNMSFTAYFTSNQYTITVNASPAAGGTVTGGGSYAYGATATLRATANSGYSFLQWSDGVTANPRTVTVTANHTYTALFLAEGGETFSLTVTSGSPVLGQVTGSGVYPAGASVEIKAIPASYARFVKWDDGNTDNPRTVVVVSDLAFVAEFARVQQYTITVQSSNEEWGQVLGGGTYNEGTQIQITAIANDGYVFTGWNDGNTDNPRTVTVTGNVTYTAQFAENSLTTYSVMLICNTSEGSVSGGGTFIGGTTTTIQAFPNPGYVFTKWSDENTQNPRTITVNSDITLVAFFATGVDENAQFNLKVYPNPAKESIFIDGIEANTQVEIYNSLGELVKVVNVSEHQEISVRDLAAGLYMIHFDKATLRFVKEQ